MGTGALVSVMVKPEKRYLTVIKQTLNEHDKFIEILKQADVRSYLEIGSFVGGSLWRVANALPIGSKIVAVDDPMPHKNSKDSLIICVNDLKELGYDAHLIFGDSTRHDIVFEAVKYAPFDAVFIDANHSLPYVRADYKNYGQMAKKLIAFHDIAATRPKKNCEVKILWDEIRGGVLHTEEILLNSNTMTNGIGVVYL